MRRVLAAGLGAPVVVHPLEAAGEVARALAGLEVAALVPGAASRTASVRAGLAALATDVEVVAVHDAARPLTPTSVLRAAVVAVTGADDVLAAAPALPVADTLKRLAPGGTPQVVGTVDRRDLVGVQTPQVFPRAVLERALAAAEATDDLALVERALAEGEVTGRIVVVPGSWWGHKVTYEDDLALVRALAAAEQVPAAEAAAGEAAVGQERS